MAYRDKSGRWHGKRSWEQCLESFWSQVVKTDRCWNWTGNKHSKGYGQYKMPGLSYRVHRASWQLANGPIPTGKHVLHKCDNPSCVNPDHLFLGDHFDNMRDMTVKGRLRIPDQKGEHHSQAKLTSGDVRVIRGLSEKYSHAKISTWFPVVRTVITQIVNRKLWPHVA